jgi:uncharacterized membrane protein
MSKHRNETGGRDTLPFVAPCRKLSLFAPLRWIRLGVADLIQAPQQSMVYGLAVAVLIGAVSLIAWFRGSQWIMFGMLGGFVFLAPLVCVGLYAISAQLERGQEPVLARSLRAAFRRHIGNEAVFALVLLVIFLVWSRAAVIVTAVMYPTDGNPTTAELVSFLTFGSGVGAIFAAVTFSASAFSLPMIMHRDVDSVTAVVTSVNAVLRNKGAMIAWLTIIIFGLVLGVVTAFVGLIVIIPVIGFATWHGYEETIDASAFPRHHEGVTATPRLNSSTAMEHDPVI